MTAAERPRRSKRACAARRFSRIGLLATSGRCHSVRAAAGGASVGRRSSRLRPRSRSSAALRRRVNARSVRPIRRRGWRCCARPASPAACWERPGDMTTRASGCSMVAAGNLRWAAPARRAAASDFVGTFEPYGQLRTHLAAFNDTAEVQDNATRVGINFRTRGAVKMFAGTEWGVNLVQSATQFNLSASGPGEFGVVRTETSPVFTARLGFVGIDFGPVGRVAIGKQNVGPLRCHQLHDRPVQRVWRPGNVNLRGGY